MSLEDEVRKCKEEIESIRRDAAEFGGRCHEEVKKNLSGFEDKVQRFVKDAREATEKLNQGVREGVDRLVHGWRDAGDTLRAYFLLMEAKSFLLKARKLAGEEEFVAAQNELETAIRDVKEAQGLLPAKDRYLGEILGDIEQVGSDLRANAASARAGIEQVVARNERLLAELEQVG